MMFKREKKRRGNRKTKAPFMERYGDALRMYLRLGATVVCSVGMAFFCYGVYGELKSSPYLNVEEIEITGINRLSDKDVSFYSGIERGMNIFSIDGFEAGNLLKNHPYVEDAKVVKKYLNKIQINITERVPKVLARFDDVYIMDEKGVFFKKYTKEDNLDLIVVSKLSKSINEIDGTSKALMMELLNVLDKKRGLKEESVSEIIYEKSYGFTLVTAVEGVKVKIGLDDFEKKINDLDELIGLRKSAYRGIKSIDLTNKRGIVVRYEGSLELSV